MAFGNQTFSDAGGAVSDLFAAEGHRYKAEGQDIEASNYRDAAKLALQNEQFTEEQTAIKLHQTDREAYQTIGSQQAEVAGSGFAASGTALDLLADSNREAALTHAIVNEQGLITEAGYKEQATSYDNLAAAADVAAKAERTAAFGSTVSGIVKGAAGIATLFV